MNRPFRQFRGRRSLSALASLSVTAAGLAVLGVAAAPPSQAEPVDVEAATLTWGLSGYAQRGIFGPWTYKNLSGNVTQLVGSVTTGATNTQTEYRVDPVPATSMPPDNPAGGEQKTPNAVKFTLGEGTADPATGAATLSWDGSYTVNAYPAMYGAPDEIYSDPELTVDADGDGELTMNFALGAGQDMNGNPVPAQDFGRLTLMTFADGSADRTAADAFRYSPDYQGVEVTVADGSAQTRSCTADGGATGWWGSWPSAFVNSVPSSIRPHFYSTSCGGMQDFKPPLPVDVDFGAVLTPEVVVSDTTLLPNGTQQVTVTGTGFDPSLAVGTRPPFSGQQSGLYIAFGRYLDTWKPSAGAPSTSRKNPSGANGTGVAVKWAVPAASFAASSPSQDPTSASYTELGTDGSFETTIQVDQSWLIAEPGNFGIYTYAGGGPTVAAYETYTPITFAKAVPTVTLTAPARSYGQQATASVQVAPGDGTADGTVTLRRGAAEVGTADLVAGEASFTLPTWAAGSHALTATYSGNDNTAEATGAATLQVRKAGTTTRFTFGTRPTATKAGRYTVRVASPTTTPTGRATVRFTKAGRTVRTQIGTLRNGTSTLGTARLARGTYRVVVTYPGNANVAGSTRATSLTVR